LFTNLKALLGHSLIAHDKDGSKRILSHAGGYIVEGVGRLANQTKGSRPNMIWITATPNS